MAEKPSKKCADRIKTWVVETTDFGGNPVNLHERPSVLFDIYLLIGMSAAIVGVIFDVKILGWMACFLSVMCLANCRGKDDYRQILSCMMVAATSMMMLYTKDSAPLA